MRRLMMTCMLAGLVCSIASCGSQPAKATPPPALPRPTTRGLQMLWWGFDDGGDPAALSRILREYVANSIPLGRTQQKAWVANGLRMVSVPRADLPELERALKVNGTQRKSLGEVTAWGTLASGPQWGGEQPLQMEAGELTLGPGRLRLIARSWTASDVVAARDGNPGLLRFVTRVEMGVQHEEQEQESDRNPLDPAVKLRRIQDAGLVLSSTVVGFDIWPREAILIFPEPPESDLVSLAGSRPEPAESATEPLGPEVLRSATPGELLLAGGVLGRHPARRAVFVLMGEAAENP